MYELLNGYTKLCQNQMQQTLEKPYLLSTFSLKILERMLKVSKVFIKSAASDFDIISYSRLAIHTFAYNEEHSLHKN